MIDQPLGAAGEVHQLSASTRRILAPNPSIMTGQGTNTYLVGTSEIAVVDPGPDEGEHLDAIEAATGGRIRWIVVTHAHPDHWPGAVRLAERTGAPLLGFAERLGFSPTQLIADGEVLPVPGAPLQVLHTPGHAPDHVCLWLEGERALLTGIT